MQPKRIGIYVRVSTSGQDLGPQERIVGDFITARGWNDPIIYQDIGSGTTDQRRNLARLMADARARRLDVVVCYKLDRLFRSLQNLVSTLQEFSELGIQFISVSDQIDMTTPSGRLLTHLLAAFAEFEASLIRERVNAGLANARKKGVKLGRPRTFDRSGVRELRLQGLSLGAIAKELGISKSAVSKTLKVEGLNNSVEIIEKKDPA